jgi:hypothetical protein
MRKIYCDIIGREIDEEQEVHILHVLDGDGKPAFAALEISAHFKEELRLWLVERARFYAEASA